MASAPQVSLSTIGQIALNTHDTEKAVAFYRDVLGLKMLYQFGQLAFFDAGGVRLMISPPEKPEFDHANSILYFKVADIRAAHGALSARGAKFENEPTLIARMPDHELWMCGFRDPEGNLLELMSEVR